jgi:hypothetical protein
VLLELLQGWGIQVQLSNLLDCTGLADCFAKLCPYGFCLSLGERIYRSLNMLIGFWDNENDAAAPPASGRNHPSIKQFSMDGPIAILGPR